MKTTTAILCSLIILSFFLPAITLHSEIFGYTHSESQSIYDFIQMYHTAYSGMGSIEGVGVNDSTLKMLMVGSVFPYFITLALCVITMVVALFKSKYYSWFSLHLSINALHITFMVVGMTGSGYDDTRVGVGFALLLCTSLTLFILSLVDIIRNYKTFRVLVLIHVFLLLFIISLGIASSIESLSTFVGYLIAIGLPVSITLVIATRLYPQLRLKENRKEIYIIGGLTGLAIIVISLLVSSGKTKETTSKQQIPVNGYDVKADTCIYLSQDKAVFIEGIKDWNAENVKLHLAEKNGKKWKTVFTTEKSRTYGKAVEAVSIETIGGKEYFFLMYHHGGGSMGNDHTEYSLYEWNGDHKEHQLSYEYYPNHVSSISELTFNEDPKTNPLLSRFLKAKVRNNEYYVEDSFWGFIDRFCSDREFQLSRVKFPLYTWIPVSDPALIDDTCIEDELQGYIKKIAINRSDWKILGENSLDAYQDLQRYYGARWQKTSTHERHITIGPIDSEIDGEYFFEKISGEWYLTGVQ